MLVKRKCPKCGLDCYFGNPIMKNWDCLKCNTKISIELQEIVNPEEKTIKFLKS